MKHLFFIFAITICISNQLNAQPTPIYPTGNINTLTPLMDWSDAQGAISYRVQVFGGATVIIDTTPSLSQYQVLSGVLDSNSFYYWRIKAFYPIGESSWSAQVSFSTMLGEPPPSPVIIYPCNVNNVPLTPIFDWSDVPSATSYRVQISLSPIFLTVGFNLGGIVVSQYLIPPGVLNYNTLYYWRVNATNSAGTGPWSSICNFTTIIGPSGIGIISSEVPTEYKLYNNYPNPFNPETKIRFDIPNGFPINTPLNPLSRGEAFGNDNVVLKVFDVLGKEVATLVNEKLQPGTYETNWNGSNYSSGIYFYQLSIGNEQLAVKKMLLLK